MTTPTTTTDSWDHHPTCAPTSRTTKKALQLIYHIPSEDDINNRKRNSSASIHVHYVDKTPQGFLRERPNRAYTTLITSGHGTVIPLVHLHVCRLLDGYETLNGRPHSYLTLCRGKGGSGSCSHDDKAKPYLIIDIEQALRTIIATLATYDSENERILKEALGLKRSVELQLVLIIDDDSLHAHCKLIDDQGNKLSNNSFEAYVTTLSFPSSSKRIIADIHGQRRVQPLVKNSLWLTQRAHLERSRPTNCVETILIDPYDSFAMYEGLITNFFVISTCEHAPTLTPTLVVNTAPQHTVLPGTIRQSVLNACQLFNVQVVLHPPRLVNWRRFQGAFITNALRVVQPLTTLKLREAPQDGSIPNEVELPWPEQTIELIRMINKCVCDQLRNAK